MSYEKNISPKFSKGLSFPEVEKIYKFMDLHKQELDKICKIFGGIFKSANVFYVYNTSQCVRIRGYRKALKWAHRMYLGDGSNVIILDNCENKVLSLECYSKDKDLNRILYTILLRQGDSELT